MRRQAFTLIELMIVIAIIAIIAAIAIPNLLESRISSNEAAAATSLKSGIHPAQVQFQGGSYVDTDATLAAAGNGIGDFANDLQYLAGTSDAVANNAIPDVALSLLPPQWNFVDATGVGPVAPAAAVTVNGYCFATASNFELNFGAVAAPQDGAGSIGRRRFAINASGTVTATDPAVVNALPSLTAFAATDPFTSNSFAAFNTATYKTYRR